MSKKKKKNKKYMSNVTENCNINLKYNKNTVEICIDDSSNPPVDTIDTPNSPIDAIDTPNSPIDTPNSPIDTPNSPIDTPNSPIDTPNSPIDTPNSPIDTPSSPIDDTPSSPIDTPSSPIDTPSSPIDTPSSPIDEIVTPNSHVDEIVRYINNIDTIENQLCKKNINGYDTLFNQEIKYDYENIKNYDYLLSVCSVIDNHNDIIKMSEISKIAKPNKNEKINTFIGLYENLYNLYNITKKTYDNALIANIKTKMTKDIIIKHAIDFCSKKNYDWLLYIDPKYINVNTNINLKLFSDYRKVVIVKDYCYFINLKSNNNLEYIL